MLIEFGQQSTTHLVDDNGSTVETVENIRNYNPFYPIRKQYKIRVKVADQKDEFEEYTKFSDELKKNPTMLDPCVLIERSQKGDKAGYYYFVKSYTILEY